MSTFGKRLRRMAFFMVGLLSVLALSFSSLMANQSATATNAWGTQTATTVVAPRVLAESASSHLEPNFYQ